MIARDENEMPSFYYDILIRYHIVNKCNEISYSCQTREIKPRVMISNYKIAQLN